MKPCGSRLLTTLCVALPFALAACGDSGGSTSDTSDTKEVLFPDTLDTTDTSDSVDAPDVPDTTDTADSADTLDTEGDGDSSDGADGDTGPDIVEPVVVDWCRLQFPTDLTVGAASPFVVYGRVYAAGVTDKSTGNDPVSNLKARLGRGASGSDPATWTTWVTANVNPGWDGATSGEADNDEYMATMQPAGLVGDYDFAFAFSLDSGVTWTYCDRNAGEGKDGSEDGFASQDAGHVQVVADPCGVNPCTTPPATCDGATLRLYPATGTCKDEGGQAACTYTPTSTTDCAATNRFCDAGTKSCVSNPCSPNPCNAPPPAGCVGNARVTYASVGTCSSASGSASCDYAVATSTDCGAAFCLDGTCRDTRPAGAGDLVITEIMFDPTAVADGVGEWFEVKNVSATTVDLAGLTVKDAGNEQFQIPGPLTLGAGASLVLGRSGVTADNGGVTVGFVYNTAMTLANSGDTIRILRGQTVVDEVTYAGGWPLAAGKSLSLDRDKAAANDVSASWCVAQAKYNAVDYGTPGVDNPNCPLSGIWCRLQFPLDLTVAPSASIDAYGRVFVAGLTDRSTGNDTSPQLVLQASVGTRGAQASTFTGWVAATPNGAYDGSEPNNDEYRAALVAPSAAGNYEFAFRASGDGGTTWTYCDRKAAAGSDGSEDGYQPANAGKLTVQISTNACDPNPCTTGKPAICEGQTAVSYAMNGACSVVNNQASCSYAEAARTDCSATGRFCQDGACTDARLAGVGDLLITEMMANPKTVTDENGEWFEVKNVSGVRINLKGISYVDNSTVATAIVTIANDLFLDPGAYAVFARSADSGVNGGITGVAGTFTFGLSNSGDFVRVYRGTDTITLANYGTTGTNPLSLSIPDGSSMQLDVAAATNTDKTDWCTATSTYGGGDKGTPGAANTKCKERIGWCRLQFPTSGTFGAGQAFTAFGRFYAAGLTDLTQTGNDASPFIRTAFAIAPKPASPVDATAAASWTWLAGTANAAYGTASPGFEANNDEWSRGMTAPAAVGDYVLGFRVSGDGGTTWTYCDTNKGTGADGSENGFSSADAGLLTVADVCTPNPCGATAPTCSGDTLTTYPAQGVCSVVNGQPSCAPGAGTPTDCAATSLKRCDPVAPACVQCVSDGDCVGPFEVCSAQRTCVEGCVADRFEPNNSVAQATVLASNSVLPNLNLCAGDTDVFAANIQAGATVSLRVDFTLPAGSNGVAVDVVFPDGTTLPGSPTTVSPFEFSTTVPIGGVWKAIVRGADAGSRAAYSFSLSFGGDPCSPNPCTTPQANRCEGDNLFTPTVPGACTAPGGQATCSYTAGTTTACAAGCSGGACRAYRAPAAGELVVTEVFATPALGSQAQWIEIYNASTEYLDLDGLVLKNDSETRLTVTGTRVIAPMSYFVFGRTTDTATNGGVTVNLVFGGTALDPVTDQVILATAGAGVIDEVRWNGTWPRGADRSTSLDGVVVTGAGAASANDASASWCLGTTGFGNGSLGTPGAANPPCVLVVDVSASTPAIGATNASPTAPIVLDFTTAMNAATLTTQTASGACTGNIRLSYNNFTTCVGFTAATATMSNGDTRATLTPTGGMAYGVAFALRVTTGATSASGTPMGAVWNGAFTTTATACGGVPVTIAQVYGGGGNQGATYTNDFIELKNRTAKPVQLLGWSLQYASATGTTWNNNLALSGVIPAGGSFLIQLAGGANGTALPTADLTSIINMSATAGKVALLTGTAQAPTGVCPPSARIVDFVGFGTTTDCNETANAPAPSATTAVHRDVYGCVDEGDGSADFMAFLPVPHNSASGAAFCACESDAVANDQTPALAVEADYCNLQFPTTISVVRNTATPDVYGRIYEGGLTNTSSGQAAGVVAQLGFGRAGTNPTLQKRWVFYPADFNVETDGGANDEYKRSFTAPAVNALKAYAYTYRFSLDGGASWTYCDLDGAGSNDPLTFDPTQLGTLEVKIQ